VQMPPMPRPPPVGEQEPETPGRTGQERAPAQRPDVWLGRWQPDQARLVDAFLDGVELRQSPENPVPVGRRDAGFSLTPVNARLENPSPALSCHWRVEQLHPDGSETLVLPPFRVDWPAGTHAGPAASLQQSLRTGAVYRVVLVVADGSAQATRARTLKRAVRTIDERDLAELHAFTAYRTRFTLLTSVIAQARREVPPDMRADHAENVAAILDLASALVDAQLLDLATLYSTSAEGEAERVVAERAPSARQVSDVHPDLVEALETTAPSYEQKLETVFALVTLAQAYGWAYSAHRATATRRTMDFNNRMQFYMNSVWRFFVAIRDGEPVTEAGGRATNLASRLQAEIQDFGLFLEDIHKVQIVHTVINVVLGIQALVRLAGITLTALGRFLTQAAEAGETAAQLRLMAAAGAGGGPGGMRAIVVAGAAEHVLTAEEALILVQSGVLTAQAAAGLTLAMQAVAAGKRETIEQFLARGGQIRKFPPITHIHHLLPQSQEFAKFWKAAGIDIEAAKYKVVLAPEQHLKFVHGGGPLGGDWNAAWRVFFKANPQATAPQIQAQLAAMRASFKI
jgi:hypothetical protein